MAIRNWGAEELAANRNLCGGIVAAAAALAGLAQAVEVPLAVRIVLAAIGAVGAVAGLCFHLLERRTAGVGGSVTSAAVPTPRALLRSPEKFVNRCDELSQLNELLDRVERGEGPLVAVLGGLPGVGKTAMSRHWAKLVSERFTDGDLAADFSERRHGSAVDVSGLLADFIRKLGPPGTVVPPMLSERVERFRSMTSDRKLLIVLDDVSEAAEVNQLRPAGKESLVLATSYRALEELHYDGAEFVPVNPLPPDRAEDLLVELAGQFGSAFEEHPAKTAELLEFCGGLPLPLAVCASRVLRGGGNRTVPSIAAEIADEQHRLDYLAGKGEYSGAAVFGFAYADLPPGQQLAYRRIGLHPGQDLAPVHAALLTGLPVRDAGAQLTALMDTHLLEPMEDGRYRFHDLVRLHARESAAREESEDEREDLLSGLVDWYRACLRKADWALITERLRLAPGEPIDAPHLPVFTDRESVFDWLEAERSNILAVLQSARDREWDEWVWQMVESLWIFHYNRRHYADWIDATELGVECAQRSGHKDAEARLRTQLAWALVELRHYDRAHAELDRANRIVRESGNFELAGSVREFTGTCYLKEGNYDRAIEALREAREVAVRVESNRGVALQDYFIAWALIEKGEYDEAREALSGSLVRMRKADDQMFVGRILLRLGQASLRAGKLAEAEASLEEGLASLLPLGMRIEEAETYEELAALAEARDDGAAADTQRERAQAIYRELGHPRAGEPTLAGPVPTIDPLTI
jgi:tetratricopeptide (TPR) repeat protein